MRRVLSTLAISNCFQSSVSGGPSPPNADGEPSDTFGWEAPLRRSCLLGLDLLILRGSDPSVIGGLGSVLLEDAAEWRALLAAS